LTRVALRTVAANNDLREIARYIGEESSRPELADKIIDEIIDACDLLAELSSTSRLGTARPAIGRGVRLFHIKRWVIIFRYFDAGVVILRIADGNQDYLSWKLQ
jgi:plasmid stabilization system protein ParE